MAQNRHKIPKLTDIDEILSKYYTDLQFDKSYTIPHLQSKRLTSVAISRDAPL